MKKSMFNPLPGSQVRTSRAEVGGKNDGWGEVPFEGLSKQKPPRSLP